MKEGRKKPILAKIILSGQIHCQTGLHIGSSKENLEIGGLDSPVVRDPITRRPYIPGSSLRGKLRSLLERRLAKEANRYSGQGVYRHECTDKTCPVCRLFGATKGNENGTENQPARLLVRDGFLTQESLKELTEIDTGLQYTELKFENALDRITAAANPRQIERVPAGTQFAFEMVYTVETDSKEQTEEDLQNLMATLMIVQDDSLGGHGSRGYGKIKIVFPQAPPAITVRKVDYYTGKKEAEKTITSIELEKPSETIQQITKFLGLQ